MDLIFHGPLGMELSLDRSAGVPRVKAAEHDSPALLAVGRALTAIEGVPVGEIRDKKSWLALVAKLQAPERPLSLTFEAPMVSPEEPVQPVQRARAELDALAASAKAAAEQAEAEAVAAASAPAPTRGRAYSRGGPRSRSPSPELTCSQCGRTGLRADGFFYFQKHGHRGLFCGEACRDERLGRSDVERASKRAPAASSSRRPRSRSRSPQRRRESSPSPPRRNRYDTALPAANHYGPAPTQPPPPGLGQRPTRRHLVAAAESARAPQPPVESCTSLGDRHEASWREATVGRCPPDDVIRDRLVKRAIAKLQRDFQRADAIEAELAREGVQAFTVAAPVKGLVRWTATDGRSGPKPPSDSEIYDMILAFERAKVRTGASSHCHTETIKRMVAEMTVAGVVTENYDLSGRPCARGALRWCCVDGRAGPPKMSQLDIEGRLRKWARAREDNDFRRSDELRAQLAARGVQIDGTKRWFTAGPGGLAGPIPSLHRNRSRSRSRSRRRRRGSSRRRRESSWSRSRSRSRKRSRKAAPSAAPGLDEQRPTRRNLVAAAPSEASSSDGS